MLSVAICVLHAKVCTIEPRSWNPQPTPLVEDIKDSSASFSLFLSWDREGNWGLFCTCSQVKGKTEGEIREVWVRRGENHILLSGCSGWNTCLVLFQLNRQYPLPALSTSCYTDFLQPPSSFSSSFAAPFWRVVTTLLLSQSRP